MGKGLVKYKNETLFSSSNSDTIFDHHYYMASDTVYELLFEMNGIGEEKISVPIGSLTALSSRKTYQYCYALPINPRIEYSYYAKGIGLIKETLHGYASVPYYTERRLLRFKVQNQ